MYKKLVKKTKYRVGEAQKEGDGYTAESYAEPQTAIVHVSEAEDGSYEAFDEDLGNVFGQMIAMPDMESLF